MLNNRFVLCICVRMRANQVLTYVWHTTLDLGVIYCTIGCFICLCLHPGKAVAEYVRSVGHVQLSKFVAGFLSRLYQVAMFWHSVLLLVELVYRVCCCELCMNMLIVCVLDALSDVRLTWCFV